MKKMKRLAALFLAVVMVMAMGMTAMAATTGNITIGNATKGEEYKAYKIFDAVPSEDGKHVAYTTTDEMQAFWAERQDNPFDFEKNVNGTWNVTQKENVADADLIAVLQTLYAKNAEGEVVLDADFAGIVGSGIEGTETTTTDGTSTTVTFSNVPYGYYLITSSLGAAVTVDSMTPNANVIDKNQSGPSWDDLGKSITAITDVNGETMEMATELSETSANYGDTIKFKISIDTTNYEGAKAITEYNISDILGDGMSYVTPSDIKVSVVSTDTSYGTNGTEVLTKDEDYTVGAKPETAGEKEDGFIITVPWADVTTNAEGKVTAVTTKYPSPAKLVVEYSAKVDADAIPAAEIKNTAGFTYKLAGEPDEKKPKEETKSTTTYTYALAINKVTEDAAGLANAKFMITKEDDTILVQATAEDGVYNYVGIATSEQVTAKNEATTESAGIIVKSPESGLIVVKGIDAGTYTITETEAPAGYNQLTNPTEVKTVLNGTYTKTITFYYETDSEGNKIITDTVTDEKAGTVETEYDVVAKTVVNNAGALLPSTGGIGTTIFYVVGGILVLGAAVLLITKKRMSARNE